MKNKKSIFADIFNKSHNTNFDLNKSKKKYFLLDKKYAITNNEKVINLKPEFHVIENNTANEKKNIFYLIKNMQLQIMKK